MSQEPVTINLKCTNCGANLEITSDMNLFACGYCGSQQLVERKGGTISLKKVTEAIEKVQVGTDKTAAELAIRRLSDELTGLKSQYQKERKLSNENYFAEYDVRSTVIWIVSIVSIFISLLVSPSLLLLIISCCIFLIIYNKYRYEKLKKTPTEKMNILTEKMNSIREKIEKQKAIVD